MIGGLTWGRGHSQEAAAYPVSSPCQSIQGSTGRSHRWGCRSHCWHRSRAGHSPAQSALQHILWAQDSLVPALPSILRHHPQLHSQKFPDYSHDHPGLFRSCPSQSFSICTGMSSPLVPTAAPPLAEEPIEAHGVGSLD